MSFYPVLPSAAIHGAQIPGGQIPDVQLSGVGQVMVAVPVSALGWPVRVDSDGDGRSASVVTGAATIRTGEPVAWCKLVMVASAVARRDGRVQADGRPCDYARLGGGGGGAGPALRVTDDRANRRRVGLSGKVKAVARREMSVAFTIRAVLLMTVMMRHEALFVRMEVGDRPSLRRRSGGVKLEAA